MSAFERFNKQGIDIAIGLLGMRSGRMRSYGDCPACGSEKRGKNDNRLPIGITPNGNGWHCHKCQISGNLTDLLSYSLCGNSYSDLDDVSKTTILDWLLDKGFGTKRTDVSKKFTNISKVVDNTTVKKKPKIDTTSDFRWEKDLWRQYKANLSSDIGKFVFEYLTLDRKLSTEVIDKADLGMVSIRGEDWLVIPLKDKHGKVINMRFRTTPPLDKTFRVCAGCPMPLYGLDSTSKQKGNRVIIMEGELDVLAMHTYGYENIVSGTTGASANWKEDWLDSIEGFQSFLIYYDNDQAGDTGAEKVAKKLGYYRCFRVKDDVFNDAGECLQNNIPYNHIQKLLENPEGFIKSRLKRVGSYQDQIEELVNNPTAVKGFSSGLNKLDPLIGGIRPGLWVVSGDTGHGKTTFLTWLLWKQATNMIPVLVTSFEQQPIGTVQKLLRTQVGNDFTKVSVSDRKKAFNELDALPIHIYDHYGEIKLDEIIECIRFSCRRHDIKIALVDHLGFLVGGQDKNLDERQAIENAVRELATIAVQDDITIMLVCHPNNMSIAQQRRVKITDLKGASAIRQDAHVGIIVERNDIDQNSIFPTTTIYVDKCRSEFGLSGSNCLLAFDPLSCYFADDWNSTPSGIANRKVICPT